MILQNMRRLVSMAACVAAVGLSLPAGASAASCSAAIDRTQAALDAALLQHSSAVQSAPESMSAKLGHQPTPATIAAAENEYGGWSNGTTAIAALRRARIADAAGDAQTCFSELRAARHAVGIAGR